MAQSGLIATVAATASEIVDHKAALSLVESEVSPRGKHSNPARHDHRGLQPEDLRSTLSPVFPKWLNFIFKILT